jgi:hypothetical protein
VNMGCLADVRGRAGTRREDGPPDPPSVGTSKGSDQSPSGWYGKQIRCGRDEAASENHYGTIPAWLYFVLR